MKYELRSKFYIYITNFITWLGEYFSTEMLFNTVNTFSIDSFSVNQSFSLKPASAWSFLFLALGVLNWIVKS